MPCRPLFYIPPELKFFLQGILGLLSAVLGTRFFLSCYTPVGEVMDLLALGNSAANFLLYCLMSTQFRATISKMLGLRARPQAARVELTVRTKLEVNCL